MYLVLDVDPLDEAGSLWHAVDAAILDIPYRACECSAEELIALRDAWNR